MQKSAQGRGKYYSNANIVCLLDRIEENLPCGGDEWNEISLRYNAYFGRKAGESRSGEDFRSKFKAMSLLVTPIALLQSEEQR